MLYVIKRGDTLDAIATRFNVPGGYQALARLNNIPNPDLIRAGATITIPDPPSEASSSASPDDEDSPFGMSDGVKTGLKVAGGVAAIGLLTLVVRLKSNTGP